MKLSAFDYGLVVAGAKLAPLLRQLGQLETDLLGARLRAKSIDRPLFITGLARSGTTILLSLLSQAEGVATHRYRDFPFLFTPVAWNRFQDLASKRQDPVERPHRDRIHITKESPEAFEEPIWQYYFPWVHDPAKSHVLTEATVAPDFEVAFRDHISKILLIRGGARYVSKGNYNVARIAYLARLFPDARFLVPIREPLAHVHSLVKQHRLFSNYAAEDPRVPKYLRAAGHYEFGPQRQPIHLSAEGARAIAEAWAEGDDYRGYAVLWAEVYAHVHALSAAGSPCAERLLVVRYEDFCSEPRGTLERILEAAGLAERGAPLFDRLDTISAPAPAGEQVPPSCRDAVHAATQEIARRFGYEAE